MENFKEDLKNAMIAMDSKGAKEVVENALGKGIGVVDVIDALRLGLEEVGNRYEKGEFFLAELIMAGEITQEISNLIPRSKLSGTRRAKIVLGTLEGDLHDIGKNIVKTFLMGSGYEIYDLGIDVRPMRFVEKAHDAGCAVIAASALLSTTAPGSKSIHEELVRANLRDSVRVIVGGGAVSGWMVEKFGVDAAVNDVTDGMKLIELWTKAQ